MSQPETENKVPYFTKLAPALLAAMKAYKESAGVPAAIQIDRAVKAWLAERGAWPVTQAKKGAKKGQK